MNPAPSRNPVPSEISSLASHRYHPARANRTDGGTWRPDRLARAPIYSREVKPEAGPPVPCPPFSVPRLPSPVSCLLRRSPIRSHAKSAKVLEPNPVSRKVGGPASLRAVEGWAPARPQSPISNPFSREGREGHEGPGPESSLTQSRGARRDFLPVRRHPSPGVPTPSSMLLRPPRLSPVPRHPSPVVPAPCFCGCLRLSPVSRPLSPVSPDAPRSVPTRSPRRARRSRSQSSLTQSWRAYPCGPWRVGLLPDRNPRSPIRSHAKAVKGTKVPDPNPVSRRAAELAEVSPLSPVVLLPAPCSPLLRLPPPVLRALSPVSCPLVSVASNPPRLRASA